MSGMYRTALAVSWACLVLGVAGCSGGTDESPVTATPVTTLTTPPQTPPYQLSESGRQLIALVKTDDTDLLRLVYWEIAARVLGGYPEGGYHLRLDCAYGNDPNKAANRLANAKIAVGKRGAAQTGLEAGKSSIDFNVGRTCRENPTPATFDPNRPLDRDYAIELCKRRVEQRYLADQLPVTLSDVTVQEAGGRWTVTATARGYSKPGQPNVAAVAVACLSSSDPLKTEVTKFDVK